MRALAIPAILLTTSVLLQAGLPEVKAEPRADKRARLALHNASEALNMARDAYAKGETKAATDAIAELRESVEVAESALRETGKDPVRNPKPFKEAEVKSRDLIKRLDGFEKNMEFDDRKLVESAKEKLQEAHDAWLLGVMGKKRR